MSQTQNDQIDHINIKRVGYTTRTLGITGLALSIGYIVSLAITILITDSIYPDYNDYDERSLLNFRINNALQMVIFVIFAIFFSLFLLSLFHFSRIPHRATKYIKFASILLFIALIFRFFHKFMVGLFYIFFEIHSFVIFLMSHYYFTVILYTILEFIETYFNPLFLLFLFIGLLCLALNFAKFFDYSPIHSKRIRNLLIMSAIGAILEGITYIVIQFLELSLLGVIMAGINILSEILLFLGILIAGHQIIKVSSLSSAISTPVLKPS